MIFIFLQTQQTDFFSAAIKSSFFPLKTKNLKIGMEVEKKLAEKDP